MDCNEPPRAVESVGLLKDIHGSRFRSLCLSVLRLGARQMVGPVQFLRPVEHPDRGKPFSPARRDQTLGRRLGPVARHSVRDPAVRHARAAAHHDGRGRVRPRLRRRRGARLGHSAQRRPRRGQVHPVAGGGGQGGPAWRTGGLHLGRGSGGADQGAGQADGPGRRAGQSGRRNGASRHPGHAEAREVRHRHRRFGPDPVVRRPRQRPRLHHPGPGLRRRTGAAGQERRPRHRPGRPRHQGRSGRRAARRRTPGRRRHDLRGRARLSVPHPARRQEPLRRHRRDRRVRNGRQRPARSGQSVRPCSWARARSARPAPPSSPGSKAPGPCWSRCRPWCPNPPMARRAGP